METTVKRLEDGSTYVITGDINAMWLRDSAAQVMHYVQFAKEDEQLQDILEGVIARQARLVCTDPYANAFNEKPDGSGHKDDTKENPYVFERKYEVYSLCAPIYLHGLIGQRYLNPYHAIRWVEIMREEILREYRY